MFAHVKWFTSDEAPRLIPEITSSEIFVVGISLLIGLLILQFIDQQLNAKGITNKIDIALKPYRNWVATVVRLTAGGILLINIWQGYLLAPNVDYTGATIDQWTAGLFGIAALSLLAGFRTRIGAGLMAIGYVLTFFAVDSIVDSLDHLEYLGLSGYLILQGGGYFSIDHWWTNNKSKLSKYNEYALPVLRIASGAGLVVIALSEKLLNMSVSQDFLLRYDWNFLSVVGINDRSFIIIAGIVELLVGWALILNLATRLMALFLAVLMIITAALLGLEEVFGHLFAIAVVFAIWVRDVRPKRLT